jgi:hypothetical protein
VFVAGMIVLEAASLTDLSDCYDYTENWLLLDKVQLYLAKLKE